MAENVKKSCYSLEYRKIMTNFASCNRRAVSFDRVNDDKQRYGKPHQIGVCRIVVGSLRTSL